MPYRVRGYPQLETARPQGTAAQLSSGRIDIADVRPGLLATLEAIGERLHRRITIFSGYRTSAYSQAVGGFAGDPHSRQIAVDANIDGTPIGDFPGARTLITRAGLVTGATPGFYRGRRDPAHVQLGSGSTTPRQTTLGQLWINAGGPPKMANIMAAIALAESGGQVDAKHTNSDGSIDRGIWQINSSHTQFNADRLLSDPAYNAQAAVRIYKGQGLSAWTTYTSGAYRDYLTGASARSVAGASGLPRTRPGGEPADSSGAQDVAWYDYLNPSGAFAPGLGWDPLNIFKGAAGAVGDAGSFFKWIAWMFHPRNILRAVEFLAGTGLVFMGIAISVKVFGGAEGGERQSYGVVRRTVQASPPGRALGVRQAARQGRQRARAGAQQAERSSARRRAQTREEIRLSNRQQERGARRTREGEVPF